MNPYQQGYDDFRDGFYDNPYDAFAESEEYDEYELGYEDAAEAERDDW